MFIFFLKSNYNWSVPACSIIPSFLSSTRYRRPGIAKRRKELLPYDTESNRKAMTYLSHVTESIIY